MSLRHLIAYVLIALLLLAGAYGIRRWRRARYARGHSYRRRP